MIACPHHFGAYAKRRIFRSAETVRNSPFLKGEQRGFFILSYRSDLKIIALRLRKNSTLSEVLLWNQLKGKKILGYQFNRQKPIGDYIVDFYCKKLGLVIEIDGISHNTKLKGDQIRQENLESFGLKVIRFNDHDIKKDLDSVIKSLMLEISKIESKKHIPLDPP